MISLAEQYPKEQARCRELLALYLGLGPLGILGASHIENVLQDADTAALSGDLTFMISAFKNMQECV